MSLKPGTPTPQTFKVKAEGQLSGGENCAWHKSRAGHFLDSEWTRHRWGMLDATAKDGSRFSALKHKVNIFYPPTAKQANESHHEGSAHPRLPPKHPSSGTDKTA